MTNKLLLGLLAAAAVASPAAAQNRLPAAVVAVVDASAAYLQRQGLDNLADGAALYASDLGATGTYTDGISGERLLLEEESVEAAVADYLALLGMERSERVRAAIASLLPPGTPDAAVAATVREMRRRWLELYGDDSFFSED